jgi:hypothetical protein
MKRAKLDLPFTDFDYESALADYNLVGQRPQPDTLVVEGTEGDIQKLCSDFEFEPEFVQ